MAADPRLADVDDPLTGDRFCPQALGLLGRGLTTDPPGEELEEVPLEAFTSDELPAVLEAHARWLGNGDPVVAAASWTNHLTTVLVPGLLAAWTLTDVGLEVSSSNLALDMDGSRPARCRILDPARAEKGRPERDRTLRSLFDGALADVFAATGQATGLAHRVCWTHVANVTAYLFDRLEEFGLAHEGCRQDRRRLLEAEQRPWSQGANPLEGAVGYEPLEGDGLPEAYQVREVCCLKTEIPGKAPCASCPRIEADRRAELVAERRQKR